MRIVTTLMLALFATAALPALAGEQELSRAENAVRVLKEVMQAPDKAIPHDLLQNAHAIAVIPDVIKAGFVVGGRHGEGLISVKTRDGTWSNPSFIGLTGGSIGFQAGVSSTDVILVFRTQRGVDSIVNGKFTLCADASAAAGPVGRSAQASTDACVGKLPLNQAVSMTTPRMTPGSPSRTSAQSCPRSSTSSPSAEGRRLAVSQPS